MKRNSRIFHIANECYIIYLGIKSDEEKPFLRVGNTDTIDDRILDVISNTVVSARFTGNPLYELKLDRKREINYIGDTAVIERMKTYLNSFELSSDGALDYHKIQDREQRDVVYFYNNGNIKLNYKEESIFDLYKRSESDFHFVYQCDEIKKSFARNPLRYTKHDFRESGFLLAGKSTLLFNGGRFFAAALDREYFSSLAAAGVDPDQISVHYTQIKGGDESDDASHSLIEMLKRSSYRNTPFTVMAENPDYARKICALFPGANVMATSEKWVSPFYGMKVRQRGHDLEVESSGYPLPLLIGDKSASPGQISLNSYTKTITVNRSGDALDIHVPQGILCNLKDAPGNLSDMTDFYISRFVPLIKGFSAEDDYKVSLAIQKLLKMLSSVVDGTAKSGLIMRSSVFNFSDMLKQLTLKTDSILTFFLENSLGILDLALERAIDMEGKILKNIHSLQSDIKGILIKSAKADPLLPVAADIFTAGKPRLFYRSVKSTAKKADYVLASQLASEILTDKDLSPRYYQEEKERLLKLIGMLESATDLEVDKILEKHKPAQPTRSRVQDIRDDRGKGAEKQAGDSDVPGSGRKGLKSSSGKGRKAWLLLLLLPLIALALWAGTKGIFQLRNGEPVVAVEKDSKTGHEPDGNEGPVRSGGGDADSAGGSTEEPDHNSAKGGSDDAAGSGHSDGNAAAREVVDSTDESPVDMDPVSGSDSGGDSNPETGDNRTDLSDGQEQLDGANSQSPQSGIGSGTDSGTEGVSGSEEKTEMSESELKLKDSSAETDGREVPSRQIVMETESRPVNAEEVKAYLNVGDYHISLVDIHLVSNRIAVDNNYRDLDYEVFDGADPDWIYPGNEIVLPDGSIHLVVRGDAIWYMAARYIRTTLDRDIPLFEANRKKAQEGVPEAIAILEELKRNTPCEAFSEKIHEVLKN